MWKFEAFAAFDRKLHVKINKINLYPCSSGSVFLLDIAQHDKSINTSVGNMFMKKIKQIQKF